MAELLDSLGKGLAHALPLNVLGKIPLMRSLSHSLSIKLRSHDYFTKKSGYFDYLLCNRFRQSLLYPRI